MAYGYQPYTGQYYNTMGYQPIQQQPQPVTYSESYIQGVQFVTEDEAKAFRVNPNQTVLLMNKDNNIFYIKGADSLGRSKLEKFKFEPFEEKTETVQAIAVDFDKYLQKEDAKSFATKDDIKLLTEKLDKIQKQVKINEILGGGTNGKENT